MVATLASCNGNCSQNAVVIAKEVKKLGGIVDTIEVFGDSNGDGRFSPDERVFVVDPRPSVKKILRVAFLVPVARTALEPNTFLTFASLFDPYPDSWVSRSYFNDDPNDIGVGGAASSVTYELRDDLIDTAVSIAVPVKVTLELERIAPRYSGATFAFVLARQPPPTGPLPRIVRVSPMPLLGLPGWGRPITAAEFGPGETLADVLARVDQQFLGDTVDQRVQPHNGVAFTTDRPMTNLVVTVEPAPSTPLDPRGISIIGPTLAFVNPFTNVSSDTSIGMAPDTTYEVGVLSSWSMSALAIPVVSGSQSDQGQFVMTNFDDRLYAALRAQGYSDRDLAQDSRFRFRTGPFRITQPVHNGGTNTTTAPGGVTTAHLQFARPTEGIEPPTDVTVTIQPTGLPPTTVLVPFPAGTADTIRQDGFVRSAGVTTHDIPIQLPSANFDDLVELAMLVRADGTIQSSDRIRFRHDVIVPTIDPAITATNTYTDGVLDRVCLVADCDVQEFELQVVGSTIASHVPAGHAAPSACTNGRREYCFTNVSLGIDASTEGSIDAVATAIDDQGNRSPGRSFSTRPACQRYSKFISDGGKVAAVVTDAAGDPIVATVRGTSLQEMRPAVNGQWSSPRTIAQIPTGTSFGLGIDMMLDRTDQQPIVCFVEAPSALGTGQLHIRKLVAGAWVDLSSKAGVRALGCSLSSFWNVPIAGWIEDDGAHWGFASNVATTGEALPAPPDELERIDDRVRDLDIAAHNGRIYFTYRTANPTDNRELAPGTIVAGYIQGSHSSFKILSDPAEGLNYNPGYGPQILVDEDGLALAFISAGDHGLDRMRTLEVLLGPLPAPNAPIKFTAGFGQGDDTAESSALGFNLVADGLTTPISVPFGRVSMGRLADHDVVVAWARDGMQAPTFPLTAVRGTEDLAVARVNQLSGNGSVSVYDRRVQAGTQQPETVATSLSVGPEGFQLVYRNPATKRLQFASEHELLPIDNVSGAFGCPLATQTSTIDEAELNLMYFALNNGGGNVFWRHDCGAGFPSTDESDVRRPFRVAPFDDAVGAEDSLLQDLLKGVQLRDGRGPLKNQHNVCIPDGSVREFSTSVFGHIFQNACNPDNSLNANQFTPQPTTETAPATTATPSVVTTPTLTAKPDLAHALAECPPGVQVFADFSGPATATYSCVDCAAAIFDPSINRCVTCATGDFKYETSSPALIGVKPRIVTRNPFFPEFHTDRVTCAGCPEVPATDGSDIMRWLVTPNGASCNRCSAGSQPFACNSDDDCTLFSNSRCSTGEWSNRRNRPEGHVCVPKCASNADCHGGVCEISSGKCIAGSGGPEVPAGADLLCRPIGCDVCWNNDFCTPGVPGQCPANHHCEAVPKVSTPVCPLRPIISPTFETKLLPTVVTDPDTLASIKARLAAGRREVQSVLRTLKIPNTIATPPLPFGAGLFFKGPIRGIHFNLNDVHISFDQGRIVLRLELSQATILGAEGTSLITAGPWAIEFFHAIFTRPRPTDPASVDFSNPYAGLGFSLVDVAVHGSIVVPIFSDMSPLGATLRERLGPFSDQILEAIVRTLGTPQRDANGLLNEPSALRCVFASPAVSGNTQAKPMPQQCPEAGNPFQDIRWAVATDHVEIAHGACR